MGLSVTPVAGFEPQPQMIGQYKTKFCNITFDSSYPTGGEPLAAADVGLNDIALVQVNNVGGRVFGYDYTNAKLLAYSGALAEVGNATDLSTVTVRAVIYGR